MQINKRSYWIDHFETILPVCSHIPHIWMLWSPNGKKASTSLILLGQRTTFSYLQLKSTSDSGIASHNVHLHHLQSLSRENLLFELFCFPPGKISMACTITSGSTDGENIFLQWKSQRIDPNHVINDILGHSDHDCNLGSSACAAEHQWLQFWISACQGNFSP